MDENKDISEREEERRLFYVALTRAAKKVFLSYASFRTIFGQRNVNIPSEFIGDIDAALIAEEDREGGVVDRSAKKPKVSLLGDDDYTDGFGRFVYV
jgi:superfamily I DNA/RNA helicase